MYHGSCLCGKIKFTLSGAIENIVHCHCSLCRKAQGSAFATNANIKYEHFNFLKGEDNLTSYSSSSTRPERAEQVQVILNEPRRGSIVHTKYFCKTCGSPIMSKNSASPEYVRVRLGTIESDISERPSAHIFTASKANWETICGELPQYKKNILKQ